MYNLTQKKEYLETINNPLGKATATQVLLAFEEYEEEWEGDLSLQSAEKLQIAFDKVTQSESKEEGMVLSQLRKYVRWCARNGYDTSLGAFEIKVDEIAKIKKQMVASPKDLVKRLDRHFDIPEKESVDVVYRTFFWLAFVGLKDSEAIQITSDMVDLSENIIRYNGVEYEFGREARRDIKKATELTVLNYEHDSPHYIIKRNRASGNIILRGYRSTKINLASFRPMINKRITCGLGDRYDPNDHTNKTPISYKKIYYSGLFYRLFEYERAGDEEGFNNEIGREIAGSSIPRKQYLDDYNKWKLAFEV